MENYTIAETFTLPSKGKVYDNELVVPTFKISSMTTNHEMRRLSPSELVYKNLCDVIDDCMVESPGISAYDMCVGDYQFCLHKLRIVTYGPEYKMSTVCPYCGYTNTEVVNLEDFNIKEYSDEIEKYREFELPITKKVIRLKLETPRRLDQVTEKIKDFKKKTNNSQSDPTLVFTISSLIDTIDGKKPNILKLDDWVRNLPMRDTNVILLNADKYNESIGIDTSMTETCDMCMLTYQTNFRSTSEFFRPTLDI
jgi:hypothetical protein